MATLAQPYCPANAISEVADFLADRVSAATFPSHGLRWRNDRAAAEVGLDALSDDQWIGHFGRFEPLPGSLSAPLALRYHGHQFRVYNPDIGDGRGFLFAQLRDNAGRLMDLGTKGSGQTPYSRFGDGRLTLKGGVREILATEMLEALGVETSRTFSLIETGEALIRGDEPSPTRSAVLVRLSHGHIRIGSFQRLAALGETDHLKELTAYALRHYFGETDDAADPARLLALVARRTAQLAASYMAAGFVHGVLNTDNINITGESFDYGPWRFAPTFDAGFTAAYFDSASLYSFGRQAEAIYCNLIQLASALRPIADPEALAAAVATFAPAYQAALIEHFLWRLGVSPRGNPHDVALLRLIEQTLGSTVVSLDRFFFDWAGGTARNGGYSDAAFNALHDGLREYSATIDLSEPYWHGAPCSMLIDEVETIWDAISQRDDWSVLNDKVTAIGAMGAALAKRRAGA